MKIVKLPNGEYYLQKDRNEGIGCFWWRVRATNQKQNGAVYLAKMVLVPKEMIGKKLMFKVEVQK